MKPRTAAAPTKRPYRTPRLVVHGDLRGTTLAKKGNKADGARKPATRVNGGNA